MPMKWTGKLIGGALGLFAGGPIGAAIGLALGHQFDEGGNPFAGADSQPFGARFFQSTFEIMGYVAKADGRVSEREIAAARAMMSDMRLDADSIRAAIACFSRGKQSGYAFAHTLAEMRRACAGRPELLRIFFELQMRVALAGSDLAGATRTRMQSVGAALGFGPATFAHLEAALRSGRDWHGGPGASRSSPAPARSMQPAEAYAVLEIEQAATDAAVSKAYRRQLSRHHPDKLQANGLPESMLEHAKQRTQQIIEAYECLRASRGMP